MRLPIVITRYPEPSPYDKNFPCGINGQTGRTSQRFSNNSFNVGGDSGGGPPQLSPNNISPRPADFVYRDGIYQPSLTGEEGEGQQLTGRPRRPSIVGEVKSPHRSSLDVYSLNGQAEGSSPSASGRMRRTSLDLPHATSSGSILQQSAPGVSRRDPSWLTSPKGGSTAVQHPVSLSDIHEVDPSGSSDEPRPRRVSIDRSRSSAGGCS